MKKELILVRHAQSHPVESGLKDVDRSLTDAGLREASRLGRYLYVKENIPERIMTSHALRSIQTARFLTEQLRMEYSHVEEIEDLYEASVRTLLQFINELDKTSQKVLIIGHNPAISHLVEHLTEEDVGSLPAGSMVHLSFANLNWAEISKGTGIIMDQKHPDQIVI